MKISKIIILIVTLTFIFSTLTMAQSKTVDPVNWRKLTPFLGDIKGWEAEQDAEGQTMTMGAYKISNASRTYKSGDKELKIEIIDGTGVQMVYASFNMMKNFEIDTSDEYVKKLTIKEYPGFEKYEYKNKEGMIMILVAERFLIKWEADHIKDTNELKQIAQSFDMEGIAKLAK